MKNFKILVKQIPELQKWIYASNELEDKETEILSMDTADLQKQDANEDKGLTEIEDMDLMNKKPKHPIRFYGCSCQSSPSAHVFVI